MCVNDEDDRKSEKKIPSTVMEMAFGLSTARRIYHRRKKPRTQSTIQLLLQFRLICESYFSI